MKCDDHGDCRRRKTQNHDYFNSQETNRNAAQSERWEGSPFATGARGRAIEGLNE
jgi:hypothetical protein